jgi:hypothetical protein
VENKLTNHLDLVIKMFAWDQYSIDSFPFGHAINAWHNGKQRYVVDV